MAGPAALARRFSRKRTRARGIEEIETQNCGGVERNRRTSNCTPAERSGAIRSLPQDPTRSEWWHRQHTGSCRLLRLFRDNGIEFVPTPYPVEDENWNWAMENRSGIFVGTREFAVPSRNHLAALVAVK